MMIDTDTDDIELDDTRVDLVRVALAMPTGVLAGDSLLLTRNEAVALLRTSARWREQNPLLGNAAIRRPDVLRLPQAEITVTGGGGEVTIIFRKQRRDE
jgi:hypothetical protein